MDQAILTLWQELLNTRHQLNAIDQQILTLLQQRFACTRQIGTLKSALGLEVQQEFVERQKLATLREQAQELGIAPAVVDKVFQTLFQCSKDAQWQDRDTSSHYLENN